jgi:dihydroceramidase
MSTVNWCEADYVMSDYVAEFWNTLSSGAIVLAGLLGSSKYRDESVFKALTLVGIGSVIFHATLSPWGQMLDEIPMVVVILKLIENTFPRSLGKLLRVAGGLLTLALVITSHNQHIFGSFEFYLFQSTYVILCGAFAIATLFQCHQGSIPEVHAERFYRGAQLFLIAWVLWLLEQRFCASISTLPIPLQLHACWHVLSAWGAHELAVFSVEVKEEFSRVRLHSHYDLMSCEEAHDAVDHQMHYKYI